MLCKCQVLSSNTSPSKKEKKYAEELIVNNTNNSIRLTDSYILNFFER
jgi:hypothetical protein